MDVVGAVFVTGCDLIAHLHNMELKSI